MEMSGSLQASAALPPGRNPGTDLIGGWENLRAGLEVLKRKKISFPYGELEIYWYIPAFGLCG